MGTFDLFHIGHVKLLKKCRELGDKVIVGLNSDEFIEKYKGKKPVMSYFEREQIIEELGLADQIIKNDQSGGDARKIISTSGANLIVVGSDWARKDYIGQIGVTWDWLDAHKTGICYLTYTEDISSTEIKRRLL